MQIDWQKEKSQGKDMSVRNLSLYKNPTLDTFTFYFDGLFNQNTPLPAPVREKFDKPLSRFCLRPSWCEQ